MKQLQEKFYLKLIAYFIFLITDLIAQVYISADSFYLLSLERDQFHGIIQPNSNIIRPYFMKSKKNSFSISFRNEHYFNNGLPNQENMDVRFFGKGYGSFNSIHLGYYGKFFAISFEPYMLSNQNYSIESISRPSPFSVMNDNRIIKQSPYFTSGIKEFQFYIHYNGVGFGISNANMWWGPGMHSSLIMSNNTTGLTHFTIGTIEEFRSGIFGFNIKYTLADYINNNDKKVYFSSLLGLVTIYSNPQISFGLSRNYLSGGANYEFDWGPVDAARLLLDGWFLDDVKKDKFAWHDPWDQTIAGYFSLDFLESKIKLYLELGVDDHRANIEDLRSQPDHTLASISGFRKYGLFSNPNLIIGMEYINLIRSRTWPHRSAGSWYAKPDYDYSSYKGRRWSAHSGSDSDDFYIIFGYLSNNFAFLPAFNYERHGVIFQQPAEIKFEWRFDFRYQYNNWLFSIYYESEYAEHLGFPEDNIYAGEVTGIRNIHTAILRTQYIIEY